MKQTKLMHISRSEIEAMDRITRLNLINHMSGYKSANLIGTKSLDGYSNLSIISSVMHLSSSPALVGFMQRPATVPRHTYTNIKETGFYTINHVHEDITDHAHFTSAKFEKEESEFDHCGLSEEYFEGYAVPFVKESNIKMAVRYLNTYEITESRTFLVVGAIESVFLQKDALKADGQIDLNRLGSVAISGLNNYHRATQLASYAYARPDIFPSNLLNPIKSVAKDE